MTVDTTKAVAYKPQREGGTVSQQLPADAEFERGLVLFLDPDDLEEADARFLCSSAERVGANAEEGGGGHYFVCLGEHGDGFMWMPLSSRDADGGRPAIRPEQKSGLETFEKGVSYVISWQPWHFSADVARKAAARDLSSFACRNRVIDESAIPRMPIQWWP